VGTNNMDVVIDVSVAEETSRTYTSSIEEINEIMTNLTNCINNIKNDWKGDSSNSFTLNHFPKLNTSMQKHVDMIKVLQSEIAMAIQDFNALDSEIKGKF